MKEVKPSKKPLAIYYAIVLVILLLLIALAGLLARAVGMGLLFH